MSAIDDKAELKLGPAMRRCRGRRRSTVWLDLGGSWIHLILMPLIFTIALVIATAAICKSLDAPCSIGGGAVIFVLVVSVVASYGYLFSRPDRCSLVLHERGFRFKNLIIGFQVLQRVRIGQEASELEKAWSEVTGFSGSFHRGVRMASAIKENGRQATLTLILTDGKPLYLKHALVEYEREDVEALLASLQEACPRVFQEPALTKPAVTALETIDAGAAAPLPRPRDVNQPSQPPSANQHQPREPARHAPLAPDGHDPACGNEDARDARNELASNDYTSIRYLLQITKDHKRREFYLCGSGMDRTPLHLRTLDARRAGESARLAGQRRAACPLGLGSTRRPAHPKDADPERLGMFHDRLRQAAAELEHAAGLDMQDPAPHAFQLSVCRGLKIPRAETLEIFQSAVGLCPDHYLAYANLLLYLSQDWQGSHDEMFGFARIAGKKAAEGSLLRALIAQAHVERWRYAAKVEQLRDSGDYFRRGEVRDELTESYHQSIGSAKHAWSPLSIHAANDFAFALAKCGQKELAQRALQRIGPCPSQYPWALEGSPIEVFRRCQAACGDLLLVD